MVNKNNLEKFDNLKSQLEQKLAKIEAAKTSLIKKNAANFKNAENISEDTPQTELRKEIELLQKTTSKAVKPKVVKPEVVKPKVTKPKAVKPKAPKPKVVKPESAKPKVVLANNKVIVEQKQVPKKAYTQKPIVINSDKATIKKPVIIPQKTTKNIATKVTSSSVTASVKIVNPTAIKKPIVAKISKTQPKKRKKSKKNKNNVFLIIALAFAMLYLGYYFKLKSDLNKDKIALEKKKQEQIDYSKKDVIFKEVEDDVEPHDLQEIDQFKDVPDSKNKRP